MASPCVGGLEFWDYVEIGVVEGLVHEDVEDECADEEDGGEDENKEAVSEHFELVILRDHWVVLYLLNTLIKFHRLKQSQSCLD